MKKIVKIIISVAFLFIMVGFEAARDLTIITKNKAALSTILTELIEEDNCKKDGKPGNSTLFDFEADILEFRATSQLREAIKVNMIVACDLNFELLEQKVLLPPPKLIS